MTELGKIERIDDLRTVWKNEARDFTAWLAQDENLAILSEAIGIELCLEEKESPVGSFFVDLFVSEERTGRQVIIENQLEETNHDHLGKIITYASGKDASIIIWIVKGARDEHRQAIEWLNQHTDENIGFFLIEIQLWKIGNSLPAPRFNIVERPNDWAKAMRAYGGLSDLKKTYFEYWEAFNKYAFSKPEMKSAFNERKSPHENWYDLKAGKSYCSISLTASMTINRRAVQIYIRNNKEMYEKFKSNKEKIESMVGSKLTWKESNKDSQIGWDFCDADFDKSNWEQYFDWYCQCALQLKEVVNKFG